MRKSAIFGTKIIGFFEIYGVSARTRGLSQCGHIADKGRGVSFSRFYADVFHGRSLSRSTLIFRRDRMILLRLFMLEIQRKMKSGATASL